MASGGDGSPTTSNSGGNFANLWERRRSSGPAANSVELRRKSADDEANTSSCWGRRRRNRDDTCAQLLSRQGKEYAEATSLHGVKYTCESGRAILERYAKDHSLNHFIGVSVNHLFCRVLWTFLCVGGVVLSYLLIVPMYTKWQEQPTFTTINSTNYPIWNIDFPAVTICSNNKVMGKQLTRELKKPP